MYFLNIILEDKTMRKETQKTVIVTITNRCYGMLEQGGVINRVLSFKKRDLDARGIAHNDVDAMLYHYNCTNLAAHVVRRGKRI